MSCSGIKSVLAVLVSPVVLLTAILGLTSGLVLLRGQSLRLGRESRQMQQDLKALRKVQRVGHFYQP